MKACGFMLNARNVTSVAVMLHRHMGLQLALIRDSEGESMKQAKRKRIKQYALTSLGLAFIIAVMAVLFIACGPQVAGG